jgi:fluoroquinolone transport system permease protein
MKNFLHLLKHDYKLFNRNNIISISILVTAIYMALFYWLSGLEDAEKILVLVIFNDPVLIGFLFAGVMVLFEKNENTLQALSVSTLTKAQYILSKSIALTTIALGCCLAMALAGVGVHFNFLHFSMATILTTLMFSFFGFMIVAGETTFNRFILKAVGLLIFMSLPFLGYFGLSPRLWFLWIPTQPAIDLFQAALTKNSPLNTLVYAYTALSFWTMVSFYLSRKMIQKSFNS